MKKQQMNKLLTVSEGLMSTFFQKLPEMLILFAIPAILFVYIFVKPQLVQDRKAITNEVVYEQGSGESNVDSSLRTIMNDVQREIGQATVTAKLDKYSTNSAIVNTQIPKLDLVGPWTCETSDSDGKTTKLYIDNKSVKLITQSIDKTEHMLLKDNCIYGWVNNGSGKKQCSGVAEALAMAEFASQSGMLDITNLIDQMGGSSSQNLKSLAASCKKMAVNSVIFGTPQGIKWVEDNKMLEGIKP